MVRWAGEVGRGGTPARPPSYPARGLGGGRSRALVPAARGPAVGGRAPVPGPRPLGLLGRAGGPGLAGREGGPPAAARVPPDGSRARAVGAAGSPGARVSEAGAGEPLCGDGAGGKAGLSRPLAGPVTPPAAANGRWGVLP